STQGPLLYRVISTVTFGEAGMARECNPGRQARSRPVARSGGHGMPRVPQGGIPRRGSQHPAPPPRSALPSASALRAYGPTQAHTLSAKGYWEEAGPEALAVPLTCHGMQARQIAERVPA